MSKSIEKIQIKARKKIRTLTRVGFTFDWVSNPFGYTQRTYAKKSRSPRCI